MSRDTNKEIEESIILLMARVRLTANDVIKELMPKIEQIRLEERKRTLEEVKLTNWELDRLSALVEKEIDNEWEMLAPGMEKAVQVYTDDLQKLLSKLKYKDNGKE